MALTHDDSNTQCDKLYAKAATAKYVSQKARRVTWLNSEQIEPASEKSLQPHTMDEQPNFFPHTYF